MTDNQFVALVLAIVAGLPAALLGFIQYVTVTDRRALERALREQLRAQLLDLDK